MKTKIPLDDEVKVIGIIINLLKNRTFDSQWRILNYTLVRLFGRAWVLSRPKSDIQ